MIQGTVHRVYNATFTWLTFVQAFEKNKTCWTKNEYPDEWSSNIMKKTLEKKIGSKDHQRTELDLIIIQQFFYITQATLLRTLHAN